MKPASEIPAKNKKKKDHTVPRKMSIAQRRALCVQLALSGQDSRDIAAYLKQTLGITISYRVIQLDLQRQREKWAKLALMNTHEHVTRELGRLQELETTAITTLQNGTFFERDSAKFCEIMLKIAKRRANLLGLDKAQKFDVRDNRTAELSDEELEEILKSVKKKDA